MNLLKSFLLLCCVLTVASCGNDDEKIVYEGCVQSDWIGTYEGIQTCEGSKTVSITVTADGDDKIEIRFITNTNNFTYTLTLDECEAIKNGAINVSDTVNASLEGENLIIEAYKETSGGTNTNECSYSATRI